MSEDCHDSNNLGCEYCGELSHEIADCPHLAAWDEEQRERDMEVEAAFYQTDEDLEPWAWSDSPPLASECE